MSRIFYTIIMIFLVAGIYSCRDKENNNSEVEILPAGEKREELKDEDRPMSRSYLLAKMRENDELSSFTEEIRRSGLEEEFEGEEGLYTIFAPSNAAYDRIPARETRVDDTAAVGDNTGDRLRYYMVKGEMTLDYLRQQIESSEDGRYEFRTALGEKIWATREGDSIVLIDVLGNKATIMTSNMEDHYGVYHIIDNTLETGEKSNKVRED